MDGVTERDVSPAPHAGKFQVETSKDSEALGRGEQYEADGPLSPEPEFLPGSTIIPLDGDDAGLTTVFERVNYAAEDSDSGRGIKSPDSVSDKISMRGISEMDPEDPVSPEPFDRTRSPEKLSKSTSPTIPEAPPAHFQGLHKFSLYETKARYYLVGGDVTDTRFQLLKLDRTGPPGKLNITEDNVVYTKREMNQLLNTVDDGNRASGGMKLRVNSWGLLGFIRFTEAYYMLLITRKQQVAVIGGHYIYQIDGTELVPLTTGNTSRFSTARNPEEARYLSILGVLDLNRSFYFSYSYDVTHTLQHNLIQRRQRLADGTFLDFSPDYNDMFIWNQHLLQPAINNLKNPFDWCLPIMHGFIDQAAVSVFGRSLYLTLIARRSRFFAGARFLKRGTNDHGYVANDVETEQIIADMLITSFNLNKMGHMKAPNYSSFVQHRGSIPLFWTQDSSGVSPKPKIDLNLTDPFHATAALHFDNLLYRYGAPICVLNLVKQRERIPRESKLLSEYQNAIKYLNQSLPEGKRIVYRAYDMARGAKTRGQDVIGTLESIARDLVKLTGVFSNEIAPTESSSCVQNGVIRSNCIDCLDRTNAAQFVIGKIALGVQLHALGVISDSSLNYDSDTSNLFAHMFNDHGDTLASQYGGSHLVNTTDSYRKINNWQSHSRDMLESFKRYYHNSFLDNQRQEAYNLFLGNYIYASGQPMLWELPTDYYLHHANPQVKERRRNYINWYTPEHLNLRTLPPLPFVDAEVSQMVAQEWWSEYYKPKTLSSLPRIFAFRMNSTKRYASKDAMNAAGTINHSPFTVRKTTENSQAAQAPEPAKSADMTAKPKDTRALLNPLAATHSPQEAAKRIPSLQAWLQPGNDNDKSSGNRPLELSTGHRRNNTTSTASVSSTTKQTPQPKSPKGQVPKSEKSAMNQLSLLEFYRSSLDPEITEPEKSEYSRYVSHPLNVPLVVSDEVPTEIKAGSRVTNRDFVAYVNMPSKIAGDDLIDQSEVDALYSFLHVSEDPLKVKDEDKEKKRYKTYGNWVKGRSFFKQQHATKADTATATAGG